MATPKAQRITIWIIAIVMTIGSLGAYFLVILENNDKQQTQADLQKQLDEQVKAQQKVDPTAYKVTGDVTELQVTDLKVGEGAEVKASDSVRVHYKGTFAQSGVKFDSSYDAGNPVTFKLDGVIKGWQQGIPGMKVGGKRRLVIPSELAYGSQAQSGIPANSDLVFEVELLAINPAN